MEHEVGTYLFRKVHPPQELLEPKVIPQRVERGIHVDENQVPAPLFVGLFQPVERLLFLLREPHNGCELSGTAEHHALAWGTVAASAPASG